MVRGPIGWEDGTLEGSQDPLFQLLLKSLIAAGFLEG